MRTDGGSRFEMPCRRPTSPNGAINPDTYASIAPRLCPVAKLEPYLVGAKQLSQIAILSAEHMTPQGGRNNPSDDGASQMLQELKWPFDVIDLFARFEDYRLLILPDTIRSMRRWPRGSKPI